MALSIAIWVCTSNGCTPTITATLLVPVPKLLNLRTYPNEFLPSNVAVYFAVPFKVAAGPSDKCIP